MMANGAGWALGALGLSSPGVSIPKLAYAGALGSSEYTTALSVAELYSGIALRQIGRRINPFANVIAAGAGSYLLGLSGTCSVMCANDHNSW
jgi:hypothetical protein